MDLENYTNINIFKKTFEQRSIVNQASMIEQSHHTLSNTKHAGFNPYQNNEGTVIGKSLTQSK